MASRTLALLFALTPLACALAAPPVDPAPPVWTNTLGMAFVKVPTGSFWMGSAESPGALEVIPFLNPPCRCCFALSCYRTACGVAPRHE